jgi:hypothetical protein
MRIAEPVALALRLGTRHDNLAILEGGRSKRRRTPSAPPAAKRGRTLGGSRRAAGPTEGGIQSASSTCAGASTSAA